MKLKATIATALIVALVAGLLLWNRHRMPAPAQSAKAPIQPPGATPPAATPPSQPVPVPNVAKMTIVKDKSAPSAFDLPAANWSTVQAIVDSRVALRERINAINSLSPHFTEEDWSRLKQFLLKPDASDQNQLGQVLKNNLMDALCALNPPPPGLGDALISIYRDSGQNAVLRDYAVQHMAAYYEQLTLQNDSSKEQQKIQSVLWEAANETGDSIGGTALLALQRLSQEYSTDFDKGKIASVALLMAKEAGVSELTHITAYQVCAQFGVADALSVVLQAAQSGETTSVKISAVAALGLLGGTDQIPYLNGLLSGTEDRLKPAARHALDQITARVNQMGNQK
jgi:hypothetical protein